MSMTTPITETLRDLLTAEKLRYLDGGREMGGTAQGFRDYVREQIRREPLKYTSLAIDAVMEATTRNWERSPRKHGADLFAIGGQTIAEALTRRSPGAVGDDPDDEEGFEKVLSIYATVADLREDAVIKLRKAAQASTAAERLMKVADEAIRRAHGDLSARLRDLADA
jgi:hypothetical protein